jgi:hypothetical protein
MGESTELVKSYPKETTLLSATGFNGWTPSTTAKVIVATSNLEQIDVDMAAYEYCIVWRFLCQPVYSSSATNVSRTVKNAQVLYQFLLRRPSNLANLAAGTNNGNASVTPMNYAALEYYNASGTHALAWAASYGIYATAPSPSFASSTATTTKVTIRRPPFNARCNGTYLSTANAAEIDQANTKLELECKVYRMKVETCDVKNAYQSAIDLYRNGM